MKKSSFPILATFFTLCSVCVLAGLSLWQFDRLAWKEGMIAGLDAAYAQSDQAGPLTLGDDFSYGHVQGIFLGSEALLLGPRQRDGAIGKDLIVPLAVDDGRTLLVNLGWTDVASVDDLAFLDRFDGRSIAVTGLLRKTDWSVFTPENDPSRDVWYKLDPEDIGRAKGLARMVGYVLHAEETNYQLSPDFPNTTRHYPNNNHLQYALFWAFMGVALVGVYFFRFIKR